MYIRMSVGPNLGCRAKTAFTSVMVKTIAPLSAQSEYQGLGLVCPPPAILQSPTDLGLK